MGHLIWELAEPCCGSAAISLAVLGARRALLPYQGSKWRYRQQIIAKLTEMGYTGLPARVWLQDAPSGAWNTTWSALAAPGGAVAVAGHLTAWAKLDPRVVYDCVHGWAASVDPVEFAAEHLMLQRLAFSGKSVGLKGGRWSSPGFNKTSAYGTPATGTFGAVRPLLPVLARDLVALPNLDRIRIGEPPPLTGTVRRVAYIDPPYVTGTRYPDGHLTRSEVVDMALRYAESAYSVIVSEGEPVQELLDLGWQTDRICGNMRSGESPFRGRNAEWITWTRW